MQGLDVRESKCVTRATGPRTPEGKAIVSKNALKHGLTSRDLLISGENKKRLARLKHDLTTSVAPDGAVEGLLVDLITSTWWRLGRIARIERDIMGRDEWTHDRKKDLGEKFKADCTGANAYLKLMRYENSLRRGLYRAFHELMRLQMMRHGAPVSAPVTIAVDLNTEAVAR